MTRISVNAIDATSFDVTVEARKTTRHRVTVSPGYHRTLTGGSIPAEELVRRSFEFLLEREPNTSILTTFDLRVIGSYFPEYEETIRKRPV
jgi:hypothetical protein